MPSACRASLAAALTMFASLATPSTGSMLHSFTGTLTPSAHKEWKLSSASMSLRDKVLLVPAVPDRFGFIAHSEALPSNDFDLSLKFEHSGPEKAQGKGQGFGLFFSDKGLKIDETAAASHAQGWSQHLRDQGYKQYGLPETQAGFGVFLTNENAGGASEPTLTVWTSQDREAGLTVPVSGFSQPFAFRRQVRGQLRVEVRPNNRVSVFGSSPDGGEIQLVQRAVTTKDRPLYLSILGHTGPEIAEEQESARDRVSVQALEVFTRHDDGSHNTRQRVSTREGTLLNDFDQAREVRDVTQMLLEHSEQMDKQQEALAETLNVIVNRLLLVEDLAKSSKHEIRLVLARGKDSALKNVKSEVTTLRMSIMKSAHSHRQQLETVHNAVVDTKLGGNPGGRQSGFAKREVDRIKLEADATIQAAQQGGRLSMLILGAIFVLIIVFGFLIWRKMAYYEKKHFL